MRYILSTLQAFSKLPTVRSNTAADLCINAGELCYKSMIHPEHDLFKS
jgi:hypothetical protein